MVPGNNDAIRLLMLEDSAEDEREVIGQLHRGGLQVEHRRVDSEAAFREALQDEWDLVLADYAVGEFGALPALRVLDESSRDLPLLVISGRMGEERAVECMRAGAADFLVKDDLTRLVPAILREADRAEKRRLGRDLEQQLERMQRLDSVGRLAGGIAHDFNNLLMVMAASQELLAGQLDMSQEQSDLFAQVSEAIKRASALTKRLLTFSRSLEPSDESADVGASIRDLAVLLRRTLGEDVELAVDADAHLPAEVGRAELEQVVMNLALNARDAMPGGGKLEIAAHRVTAGDRAWVEVTVRDGGVGMTADVVDRIYEPFFSTKTSNARSGSGLGLATVFGIVSRRGGEIHVETEPDRGTTFRVRFPSAASVSSETTKAVDPPPTPADQQGFVLVVEDDALVRVVIERMLKRLGYGVDCFPDAASVLAWLESDPDPSRVQLMITDVIMPRMSGVELSLVVRERWPDIPVLFVSGYDEDRLDKLGAAAEERRILWKPFTAKDLAAAISAATG